MFVKALRSKRWNVGLGKTFNLSYHMINSDGKSKIMPSDGFQQIGRQAKMAT